MTQRAFQTQTPLEALLVEQALLLARQLQTTADDAPNGHVLARVELAAVSAGREFTRQAVEATLQQQADAAEKKGHPNATAPSAARPPVTKDTPNATS